MPSKRKKLYITILLAAAFGYIWIFLNFYGIISPSVTTCLFKTMTGLPCPSCGATRSALEICHGHFLQGLLLNPIGYIITMMLLIIPGWIVKDLISDEDTFYNFYQKVELLLKRKLIAIPAVILLLSNWYWNILKAL
jgi:hypothetical protein